MPLPSSMLPRCAACAALLGLVNTLHAEPASLAASPQTTAKPSISATPSPAPGATAEVQTVAAADSFSSSGHPIDNAVSGPKRSVSEVLVDLLDMEGVRVVAEVNQWDRPDTLAMRHYFRGDSAFRPYASVGLNRAVYLSSAPLSLAYPLSGTRRSFGPLAEFGAAWRLAQQFELAWDVHWLGLSSAARVLRTDAGFISADPVVLNISLVWRRP